MTDWPLIGNRHITSYLKKSIVNNQLSNAYIFSGVDDLGKTTLASFFSKLLLCSDSNNAPCGACSSCKTFCSEGDLHPDYHLIKRNADKKNISIKQIREFIHGLSLSPFVGRKKVGIIKHADTMSIEAFNAMLKTLEEAKAGVILILVVNDLNLVPDTVKSRCQLLNFRPVNFDEIYDYLVNEQNVAKNSARNYAKICLGRPALALKFLQDQDFYHQYLERVEAFLSFFQSDINSRFSIIEKLMLKESGQIAVKNAYRILNVWSGVLRDLLLISINSIRCIQHQLIIDRVNAGDLKVPSQTNIISLYKKIKQSEEYLANNINPKSVLEGVAMGNF